MSPNLVSINAEDSIEGCVGPRRRKLPDNRKSKTTTLKVAGFQMYVTAGMYDDGTLGELFIKEAGREGSLTSGLLDIWATTFSIALQYGAEFPMMARKFHHAKFEPDGWFDSHPEFGPARSIIDAIMKWLVFYFGDDELKKEVIGHVV